MVIIMVSSIVAGSLPIWFSEDDGVDDDVISETGTVKYVDLEGGFYGIVGDDGTYYDPINLEKEFKLDGLRIYYKAKIYEDVFNAHMWGTPIEIIEIESLK